MNPARLRSGGPRNRPRCGARARESSESCSQTWRTRSWWRRWASQGVALTHAPAQWTQRTRARALAHTPHTHATHTHTHAPMHGHARKHAYAHTRTHTFTHAHTHKHAHKHTRTHSHPPSHTRTHTRTRPHAHAHTHTHKHTNTHASTHAPTHTHTHTHTHTQSQRANAERVKQFASQLNRINMKSLKSEPRRLSPSREAKMDKNARQGARAKGIEFASRIPKVGRGGEAVRRGGGLQTAAPHMRTVPHHPGHPTCARSHTIPSLPKPSSPTPQPFPGRTPSLLSPNHLAQPPRPLPPNQRPLPDPSHHPSSLRAITL